MYLVPKAAFIDDAEGNVVAEFGCPTNETFMGEQTYWVSWDGIDAIVLESEIKIV